MCFLVFIDTSPLLHHFLARDVLHRVKRVTQMLLCPLLVASQMRLAAGVRETTPGCRVLKNRSCVSDCNRTTTTNPEKAPSSAGGMSPPQAIGQRWFHVTTVCIWSVKDRLVGRDNQLSCSSCWLLGHLALSVYKMGSFRSCNFACNPSTTVSMKR